MNQKVFRKETIVLFDGAVSYGLDIPKSGDSRLEKIVEKMEFVKSSCCG